MTGLEIIMDRVTQYLSDHDHILVASLVAMFWKPVRVVVVAGSDFIRRRLKLSADAVEADVEVKQAAAELAKSRLLDEDDHRKNHHTRLS